jgi:predicted DNA-binding transcriptional regulator AlpA
MRLSEEWIAEDQRVTNESLGNPFALPGDPDFPAPVEPVGELVGVAEVCDRLGIKRMTLKRLRDSGKFPAPVAELRAGPVWRLADIEAWD